MITKKQSKEIRAVWQNAEDVLKKVERLNGNIVIPSINELRNAGFHLARAISPESGDDRSSDEHVELTILHCKRAIYDAVEVGILHCLNQIKNFDDDYKFIEVTDVITDYLNKRIFIDEIKSEINMITRHNTIDYCDKMYKHLDSLILIVNEFEHARIELAKRFKKWRYSIIYASISIVVMLAGLIIAILFNG